MLGPKNYILKKVQKSNVRRNINKSVYSTLINSKQSSVVHTEHESLLTKSQLLGDKTAFGTASRFLDWTRQSRLRKWPSAVCRCRRTPADTRRHFPRQTRHLLPPAQCSNEPTSRFSGTRRPFHIFPNQSYPRAAQKSETIDR